MKMKVGDTVVPKIHFGKVISITKQEVIIEWIDSKGIPRQHRATEENAHLRGRTLDEHVDESFVIIENGKPV